MYHQELNVPETEQMYKEACEFGFEPIMLDGISKHNNIKNCFTLPPETIRGMFEKSDSATGNNVGILTGERSRVIVIDVDTQNEGVENWNDLLDKYMGTEDYDELNTPYVVTPSGGYHFYFLYEHETMRHLTKYTDVFKTVEEGCEGIDLLCNKATLVYPGSVYPYCKRSNAARMGKCGCTRNSQCRFAGRTYKWEVSPREQTIKKMPTWLKEMLPKKKQPVVSRVEPKVEVVNKHNAFSGIQEFVTQAIPLFDQRRAQNYDQWCQMIWCLRGLGASISYAHAFSKRCPDKYDANAVERVWNQFDSQKLDWSVFTLLGWLKSDLNEETYLKFTNQHPIFDSEDEKLLIKDEYGLADLLAKYAKGTIIQYDGTIGDGYVWNPSDKLWDNLTHIQMAGIVTQILQPINDRVIEKHQQRLLTIENIRGKQEEVNVIEGAIKEHRRVGRCIRSMRGLRDIVGMCVARRIFYDPSVFTRMNADPHLFPIADGKLVDLRTLTVRDRTQSDLFSFSSPIQFIEGGEYPNARKYFSTIACGDEDLIRFFQLYLGYCMTGLTTERSVFIHWGEGRNGKSALFELLKDIMGEYYTTVSSDVLLKRQNRTGGATPELMSLIGRRMAVYSESDDGSELNATRIKTLVGEDTISARALYKNEITFKPVMKLCMLTNHKPKFDISDRAMVDRIVFVPFLARFENTRENKEYIQKVRTEYRDEIASFLLQGAHDYINGAELTQPSVAKSFRDDYLVELDTVRQFLNEKVVKKYGEVVLVSEMKKAYDEYCCTELQETPMGSRPFNTRLKKLEYTCEARRIDNKVRKVWANVKFM
jgi:P4 family phage/plasmid primase-like protien